MKEQAIGVDIDDLRIPAKEAIRTAGDLGFNAVELPAATGDLSPPNLSSSGRRHLLRYLKDLGLSLAALGADMPGSRFTDPGSADMRIEKTRAILELATELRTHVVTASVGALTHPDTGEPSPTALEALAQIGDHADLLGTSFAIRPSYDSADRLARILDALGCPALKIGLDPAAMVMAGINPLSVIEHFPDQIAIVHARDATVGGAHRSGRETSFGEGEVDLATVYAMLEASEYEGTHILRRTDSQSPVADLAKGREALLKYVKPA
jgi:sugar phosphate isomerase/epimerase